MGDLLCIATETAQQLKRSAGVPFHAKGRGLLRKMDTTSKPDARPSALLLAKCDDLPFGTSHCAVGPAEAQDRRGQTPSSLRCSGVVSSAVLLLASTVLL